MEQKQANTQTETLMHRIVSKIINPQFYGFIASIAILAAISFFYFYPDVVQGNELRQYDMQQGAANGQEAKEHFEATGEKTLWTNSLFSGMPTFQISPYYESNDLFSWINDIMGFGLPAPANLLFMMMVGFLILMLAFKVRWYIAVIGAIAYGFSSYFIILIGAGHIWKFITLAYIPPTIAGIVLCYRRRYLLGGALAALFAMMQISSNHVQMSYYFLFVIIGLVIAYLIMALRKKQLKQWTIATATLMVAGILAVTANLPSLYNTYEYSKETMRGKHSDLVTAQGDNTGKKSSGLDKDYIMGYSYTPSETFTLLIPNVKGGASVKPEQGRHKPLTLYDLPEAQDLIKKGEIYSQEAANLQAFSQYFGAPEGTNGPVYVGALIFALFLLGCIIVKGPIKWILVALTLLSIFLAWGRYMEWFTMLFIDYIPMYNKFRTVESILVIAEFTMPLLGILALHKLFTTPQFWNKYAKSIYAAFGTALFFCLLGILSPGIFGSYLGEGEQGYIAEGLDKQFPSLFSAVETLRYSMVRSDALRSFLFIAVGGVVLLLMMRRKIKAWGAVAITFALVLGDLYMVNKRYLNHDSFCTPELTKADPFPLRPADRKILTDTAMNYRVLDLQNFGSPSPSYHHKMVGGYHAAKLTRYQDMISRHIGRLSNESDINVLNMLNTKYIISDANTAEINPEALGNAWWVENIEYADNANAEMAALDTLQPAITAVADVKFKEILGSEIPQKLPGDTIFETTYAPNRLTYHAHSANGGLAVFSEVYFPWGWKATIDGNPAEIGRVNYLLRALRVPAGSHTIEMKFDPDSIRNTVNAARIAIILIYVALIGAAVLALTRKPKQEEDTAATDESY